MKDFCNMLHNLHLMFLLGRKDKSYANLQHCFRVSVFCHICYHEECDSQKTPPVDRLDKEENTNYAFMKMTADPGLKRLDFKTYHDMLKRLWTIRLV